MSGEPLHADARPPFPILNNSRIRAPPRAERKEHHPAVACRTPLGKGSPLYTGRSLTGKRRAYGACARRRSRASTRARCLLTTESRRDPTEQPRQGEALVLHQAELVATEL